MDKLLLAALLGLLLSAPFVRADDDRVVRDDGSDEKDEAAGDAEEERCGRHAEKLR